MSMNQFDYYLTMIENLDFDYLMNEIDRISVYETGHALVTDNNLNVIHSVHYPKGPLIDDFYNADSNFKIENLFSEETLYQSISYPFFHMPRHSL